MEKQAMYYLTGEELQIAIKKAVVDALNERENRLPEREYTFNKAAKLLGLSWDTVRKRVKEGRLKITGTGRITEKSIREFLDQQFG